MARTLACDASRQSTPLALPERIPDDEFTEKEYRELARFNWSMLNTPAYKVHQPKLKAPNVIHKQCKNKLHLIEESFGLPSGLLQLIDGTKALMDKDWENFVLYTDFDDQEPEDTKYWSNIQMRKCDLVEWFTTISCQYHSQIEKAAQQGAELDTKEVDEEFLTLLEVILTLEESDKGIVGIKEWERLGTKATLQVRELMAKELAGNVSDGEDDDDDESENEVDWFPDHEWETALMGIRAEPRPGPLVRARPWSVELPVRDDPKP